MLYRGVAVLGLLAVSPAHADLIEYSFSSTIANYGSGMDENVGGDASSALLADSERFLTAMGGDLRIGNTPLVVYNPGSWGVEVQGNGHAYSVNGLQIYLQEWFCGSPIKPTSLPEPASLALLAGGALGTLAVRRRKQSGDEGK
jgi:hypothetical protein